MGQDAREVTGGARFIGAGVGFLFAGIGVTVLVFLSGAPFDDFHSPPLFFRIFGSFVALMFVLVGGGMGVAALRAKMPAVRLPPAGVEGGAARGGAGYKCPHCGGPLGEKSDVSPSGDVKCGFCGRWFNVHGR